MSGIDAPKPWETPRERAKATIWKDFSWFGVSSETETRRYAPPATPPPNGTRSPCPICRCKPGEPHKRERPSLHAHSYAHDPEDTALD